MKRRVLAFCAVGSIAMLVAGLFFARATAEGAKPSKRVGAVARTADPLPVESAAAIKEPTKAPIFASHSEPEDAGVLMVMDFPGLPVPPHARRHRWVEVPGDFFTAKGSPFWARKGDRHLDLNLFPGLVLPVEIQSSEVLGGGRYVAKGTIEGRPESRVFFAMTDGALSASIYDPEIGRYVIEGAGPDNHIVYEVNMDLVPDCGEVKIPFLDQDAMQSAAKRMSSQAEAGGAGDPPSLAYQQGTPVIDVMVVYSSEITASVGHPFILSKIDLAILEANDDFARSGIAARVRLVHASEVNVQETGSFDVALERIRKIDDGFMDEVHALRDQHGADLVSLIVFRTNGSTAGQAYLLNKPWSLTNQSFAFGAVHWTFLTGTSTFTHELGHNLGCTHDRENTAGTGAYSYSFGYRFFDLATPPRQWRTIMAYSPGSRSGYFSNPRLTSPPSIPGNVPLGIAGGLPGEADNARTVDQSAFEIANYRLNKKDPFARGNLLNVSTRALIGSDERQLIGGFILEGAPKTVLVRSTGPALLSPPYDLPGALVDPKIEVIPLGQSVPIASNDDYVTSPDVAAIRATGFAPTDSREPAVLLTLNPGGYTALVSGKNGATGIGLIEVFEVGRAGNKIVNLSTRGWVSVDSDVMIGGFILEGNPGETKRLLVRVLGPTLEKYDVPNSLFDPAARLYNVQGEVLLDNDDWDAGPHQEKIRALGLAPDNRREPAMLIDIAPGAYTVIVRPFENPPPEGTQPGVALIEVYEITTDP